MNDTHVLDVGLHVCRSIERTADGNLAGIDCDQASYSSMDVLHACVVGRPPTVARELRFYLNDSIVDKVDCGSEYLVVYTHSLDERFLGSFKVVYIENGCNYWSREFVMGVCTTAPVKPPIEVSRLADLLRKFRRT